MSSSFTDKPEAPKEIIDKTKPTIYQIYFLFILRKSRNPLSLPEYQSRSYPFLLYYFSVQQEFCKW